MIICSRLYDTAIRLGNLQAKLKLPVTPEEYAQENLKFGLVEVVYEWAKVPLLNMMLICCFESNPGFGFVVLYIFFLLVGNSICRYLPAHRCSGRSYSPDNCQAR